MMSIPTLYELFEDYRQLIDDLEINTRIEAFRAYFSGVASGETMPFMTNQNAIFAAQTVLVVLEHVEQHGDLYSPHKLTEMVNRSGLDVSPCRLCGKPVICLPDGLACCKACLEKVGA